MAPPIRLPGDHRNRTSSWTRPVRQSWNRLKQVRGVGDLARWSLRSFRLAHLPLRIRPALVLGTFLALLILSMLGFHPTLASHLTPSAVPWSDKLLHFICFGIATALFYSCWVVEEHARRVTFWRYWNELVSLVGFTLVGGIGSEFVQALLPYKSFQVGDVVANLLGSGLAVVAMHHYSREARRAAELRRLYVHLDQISPEDDEEDYDDEDDEDSSGSLLDDQRDRDRDPDRRRRGNGAAAAAEAGLLRREMQESRGGGGGGSNMRFARVDHSSGNTKTDSVAKRKQQQALDPWSATDDEIFGLGDDGDDGDDDDERMRPPPGPPSLTVTPPPPPPPPAPGGT